MSKSFKTAIDIPSGSISGSVIATQAWVQSQGYSTGSGGGPSGPSTGTGSVVYSDSPTHTGTVSASNIVLTGNLTASTGLTALNSTIHTSSIVFGSGHNTGTPTSTIISGPWASGTDIAGGDLVLGGGRGAGAGNSGYIRFNTQIGGGSGTTQNATQVAGYFYRNLFQVGMYDATSTPNVYSGGFIVGPSGTGTDIGGGNLTISAGNGTGTGGSGSIIFRTASAASTGTTANTQTNRMTIDRNGLVNISGSLSASNGITTLGLTNYTYTINPAGGSTTAAPIDFTAGTNMTSPTGGEMEYDGTAFYLSGKGSSTTGRGIVLAPQTIRTVTTRAKANNNTSLEAVFDTANDTITLDAGLVYYFRGTYLVGKSATGVTATINTGFNFSASTSNIGYTVISYPQATGTAQQSTYVSASTSTAVTATSTTAASYVLQLEGWFVSNGGTFVPAFTQSTSGTAAAPAILGNSWFMLQAMGTSSATNIAGSWA